MKKNISIECLRLKEIRKENNYSQKSFADLLDVPSTTADIERGKSKVSGSVVVKLIQNFNINPLWLYGKSKQKFLEKIDKDISPKVITINSQQNENILLVSQKAAAGYPQNIQDSQWFEQLPAFDLPLPQYRNATYRGFQVEGDSMMPNIRPMDWVIGRAVTDLRDISDNRVYVIVLKDSLLVKKIQKLQDMSKVRLISINTEYIPFDVQVNDIQEMWQVNSKLTFGVTEPEDNHLLHQLQESMRDLKTQIRNFQK
ncbi:MAG: DNA-binding protein [Flavobacteriaceae bacterium CG2_30_34_30]|nr:MAG: DNA-binding protein [Flavobacteriaceae bacterium CG2_30_34_30]PIQ18625.1 MAG: DNA-binding protein [Flavobacteriaceae bacterium CG18_big_fil_WC_8_21_14_2_50_34_36]PIZ09181.1 MAG: DNA-binding protein [Flavobacteriaceae bacterium CG_4_10_14_0_8_um_filter_34_31]PJC06518.1 MAG: DNA-binding protein [Flavobacteriaceae bacterium CG_4_9_14_0_8_um_filter_34_30]